MAIQSEQKSSVPPTFAKYATWCRCGGSSDDNPLITTIYIHTVHKSLSTSDVPRAARYPADLINRRHLTRRPRAQVVYQLIRRKTRLSWLSATAVSPRPDRFARRGTDIYTIRAYDVSNAFLITTRRSYMHTVGKTPYLLAVIRTIFIETK